MVVSAQDCASDALLFTWSAISSPGRQNSAIFDANHLAVGSETWVLIKPRQQPDGQNLADVGMEYMFTSGDDF